MRPGTPVRKDRMDQTRGEDTPEDRAPASSTDALAMRVITMNSVRLTRPRQARQGALRDFDAHIVGVMPDGDQMVIGSVSGHIGWLSWLPEVIDDAGQATESLTELVEAALDLGDRLSAEAGIAVDPVLMIERIWIEPPWRGNRLSHRVAEQLVDLLLLTPESTLVLARLEPSPRTAARLAAGASAGGAMHTESDGYLRAGFHQWRTSTTWWMHPAQLGRQM